MGTYYTTRLTPKCMWDKKICSLLLYILRSFPIVTHNLHHWSLFTHPGKHTRLHLHLLHLCVRAPTITLLENACCQDEQLGILSSFLGPGQSIVKKSNERLGNEATQIFQEAILTLILACCKCIFFPKHSTSWTALHKWDGQSPSFVLV